MLKHKSKFLNATLALSFGLSFLTQTTICAPNNAQAGSQNQKAAAAMPDINISEDQMQKMEVMMHEMEHFYENLSPAEKAQFEKELASEVEAEQKKLAAMDPSAQKKYIETAFNAFDDISIEELMQQLSDDDSSADKSQSKATESTSENKDQDKEKKAAAELEQNKKKIKELVELISNIIKTINNLTGKLNGIKPSAQDLIDKWIQKGYVQKWAGSASNWNTFNSDLSTMKQRLEKLKQTDSKTGKYLYLNDIKNVEKLRGQLDMVYSTIKKYEPSVEINSAGQMKNEASKSALTKLINYLADTTKTVTKSADEIISKFSKEEAPKYKKQEEDAAKKASRKPYARGKTSEAGRAESYREENYLPYSSGDMPNYYGPAFTSGGTSQPSGYSAWDSPDTFLSSSSDRAGGLDASRPGAPGSSSFGSGKTPGYDSNSGSKTTESPSSPSSKSYGIADNVYDKNFATPDKTSQQASSSKLGSDDLTSRYKKINGEMKGCAAKLNELDNALDDLKSDPRLKNNTVEKYFSDAKDIDASFSQKIQAASTKSEEALQKTSEFVDNVNKFVKEPNSKAQFRDSILKEFNDIELNKAKQEINTKIINPASKYKNSTNATYQKIFASAKGTDFENLENIENNISEIETTIRSIK